MQQRPQNVTDVLCREVGASHPDGALRQIRTMKRVLRMHYRSQKKLERFGVDDCMEAVACISDLRGLLRKARTMHRKQAQANVQTVDEAIALLRRSLQQLRDSARPAESLPNRAPLDDAEASDPSVALDGSRVAASSSPTDGLEHEVQIGDSDTDVDPRRELDRDQPAAGASAETSLSTLDAFETVAAQLDELRLEMWIEAGSPGPHSNASGQAENALSDAEPILNRMEEMMQALTEQNRSLRRSCQNLQERNRHLSSQLRRCQRRIDVLEDQVSP